MKLAISNCKEYKQEEVFLAVEEAVNNLGGIAKFVQPGQKVLLKPNWLTAAAPEKAVTTHPFVVEAVIRLVQQAGGKVFLGDSPGFGNMEWVLNSCGYGYLLEKYDLELADFSTSCYLDNPQGKVIKKIPIARAVKEADVIINLPKIKTHVLTVYTGSIKNVFGCVPGLHKGKYHLKYKSRKNFSNFIVDVYTLVKPRLTVMDGIIGMEGFGPRNGFPKKIGLILACPDGVVLDQYITQYLGLDFRKVPLIKEALERGLGVKSLSSVEILGDIPVKLDHFLWPYGPKINGGGFIQRRFAGEPNFIAERCTRCRTCINVCPPKALKLEDGKIKIDRKVCIKCYCCQELCPENAVEIKPTKIGRFLRKK
ncbi:MAG TPA: DUF362 domain-containing protein [Clostridia bacterium]|nr:DUF362 domain-containing protein [Clostridia bacterium]